MRSQRPRTALGASLAVHVALAWLMLGRQARRMEVRPCTPPDVVEVSFEVEKVSGEPAASLVPPEGTAAPAGVVVAPRPAGTSGAVWGGATGLRAGKGAMPAANEARAMAEVPLSVASSGASAVGESDRLSTFRRAHPDLLGGVRAAQNEIARDLLAAPLAKEQAGARELPKVLHGSGGVTARVGEDGSIHFGAPKDVVMNDSPFQAVGEGAGVGIGGRLDVTDQIMKLAGQEPYSSAKRAIADETREERLCMARRYQGERKKQELFDLASKIRRVAARVELAAAERRALVFDIWDECTEETETGTDYGATRPASESSRIGVASVTAIEPA